jgi:hypothetical protein
VLRGFPEPTTQCPWTPSHHPVSPEPPLNTTMSPDAFQLPFMHLNPRHHHRVHGLPPPSPPECLQILPHHCRIPRPPISQRPCAFYYHRVPRPLLGVPTFRPPEGDDSDGQALAPANKGLLSASYGSGPGGTSFFLHFSPGLPEPCRRFTDSFHFTQQEMRARAVGWPA